MCVIGTLLRQVFPGRGSGESKLGHIWIVLHDPFQLLHPCSKIVRDASAAPPTEPFEGLIDFHLTQAITKGIPSQVGSCLRPICIEVRPPQRQPLLTCPMPCRKATQVIPTRSD